ncbi:MAG: hypothetical protein NZ576_03755 [Bacteroidia bacterium]|nr:hypothetical protein [Bacteroidia bacterium]
MKMKITNEQNKPNLAVSFLGLLGLVIIINFLISWIWYSKILWMEVLPGTFVIAITTLSALILAYKAAKQKTIAFLQKVILGMFLKLCVSLVFFVLSLKLFSIEKSLLIASYFFAYFCFTFFEVWVLLNKLRA